MADNRELGFTRPRDLAVVALVCVVVGNLLLRFSYSRLPGLPTPAGLAAAVVGLAEAGYGWGLYQRIRDGGRAQRRPLAPLTAARALLTAKATALAGAALGGLWIGALVYLVPKSGEVTAARHDETAAVIGVVGALVMAGGALVLEFCCRTPPQPRVDDDPR